MENTLARAARTTAVALAAAAWFAGGPVSAAEPEVTLELESAFGKFGFYTETFPANQVPPDGFSGPRGIEFLDADRLVIADRGNNKLQFCDLAGDCRWFGNDSFNSRNTPGVFDRPHGVAVGVDGFIAVADEDNHAVQRCDEFGTCRYSGDSSTTDNKCSGALGRWCFPQDVEFNASGDILGLDTGNRRIQVLRLADLFVQRVIQLPEGSGSLQFSSPRGLAVHPDGRLVIADTGNHRIQLCEQPSSGSPTNCSAFGGQGSEPGRFDGPVGVEVDAQGVIWVADTGNARVQACNTAGECRAFGGPGEGDGTFDAPTDVAVHPSGRVAVVDTERNRITVYRTEPAAVTAINAGMNDAWFNPETPGQGFFFAVFPPLNVMFLAHFTFDTQLPPEGLTAVVGDAGHRWVTAVGSYSGNRAVLDMELTTGGVFDALEPVPEQTSGYGTYTVEFSDCMNATVAYEFPGAGLSGSFPLRRIVADNAALCEALQEQ